MATGNGAYVAHKNLESRLKEYRVIAYTPYLTLLPPALYAVGREHKANLIHTASDYGGFFHRRGVPLVITFHNYVLDTEMQRYSSTLQKIHYQTNLKWFTRQSINQADAITAVSHFTAELARKELRIDKKIRVIHNGIDESIFCPRPRQERANKIKVLFSGNLTSRKGAQWLLPIVKKLSPHITLYYTSGLQSKTGLEAHPNLKNLGAISHQEMPSVYNAMDILLFPTVREGLSLAALEAMACGLPVIATDCSSMPELIDDGLGGFLCGLGDVQAFAQRINQLADDVDLRKTMGEYNRDKVERLFTLTQMAENYRQLFASVLERC